MKVCPESAGGLVLLVFSPVGGGRGVERFVVGEGLGLAHCWVLKHQAPCFLAVVVGGWGTGFWFLPLLCHALGVVGGWWGCCLRSA
jgi:hypothetical protein